MHCQNLFCKTEVVKYQSCWGIVWTETKQNKGAKARQETKYKPPGQTMKITNWVTLLFTIYIHARRLKSKRAMSAPWPLPTSAYFSYCYQTEFDKISRTFAFACSLTFIIYVACLWAVYVILNSVADNLQLEPQETKN